VIGQSQAQLPADLGFFLRVCVPQTVIKLVMAFTMAVISSLLICPGPTGRVPASARRHASVASFLACVSCLCDPLAGDYGIATGVQSGPVLSELPLALVDLLAGADFPGEGDRRVGQDGADGALGLGQAAAVPRSRNPGDLRQRRMPLRTKQPHHGRTR
jgi:hypothetical protein